MGGFLLFIKSFFKKMFCVHRYNRIGAVFASVGIVMYKCERCGRIKK